MKLKLLLLYLTICFSSLRLAAGDNITANYGRLGSNHEISTIRFFHYTRANQKVPVQLDSTDPHYIKNAHKVIVIVPGWLASPFHFYFPELKDEYLKRYNCSVIAVDYSPLNYEYYRTIADQLPTLSYIAGAMLCNAVKLKYISLKKVHLIGHSLGGQLAGLIGQATKAICKRKLGRITALDPAALLFQEYPRNKRLDKSDAKFVDVIHTAAPIFSWLGNIGHVDFHVNCGFYQTGCPDYEPDKLVDNMSTTILVCHHERSIRYMVESVNTHSYIAQSCADCPHPLCKGDSDPEYIVMGEDCPRNSTKKVFWLPINPKSPFGSECSLYPHGCK